VVNRPAALKLAHAHRRLKELEGAVADFIAQSPFAMGWEMSEDRRNYSVFMRVRAAPPDHHLGPVRQGRGSAKGRPVAQKVK